MPTLNLEVAESQIVDWIRNFPEESKQEVLRALIPHFDTFEGLVDRGETRIREICAQRGITWEDLTEAERTKLVDEILHES